MWAVLAIAKGKDMFWNAFKKKVAIESNASMPMKNIMNENVLEDIWYASHGASCWRALI